MNEPLIKADAYTETADSLIAALRLGVRVHVGTDEGRLLAALSSKGVHGLTESAGVVHLSERALYELLEWAAPQWRWWGNARGSTYNPDGVHSANVATVGRRQVRTHAGIKVRQSALVRVRRWAQGEGLYGQR